MKPVTRFEHGVELRDGCEFCGRTHVVKRISDVPVVACDRIPNDGTYYLVVNGKAVRP